MLSLRYYYYLRKFLIKQYPNYFRFLNKYKDVIKYIITGVLATLTNLFFLFLFYEFLELRIILAVPFAFIIAFIVSFSLQKLWTFRNYSKKRLIRQLIYYFSFALFGLFLNTSLMYYLVEVLAWWYLLAQLLVTIFLAGINFFVYKFIIFYKK